jgi:hypothetical protein
MTSATTLEVVDHSVECIERLSKNDLTLRSQIY